jgi:holo-[acyl-carrier protein] synthase
VSIAGIGQDLLELSRVRTALERHGERFLKRCFTANELEYCLRFKDPVPELAARFAAKEAASKALGTGIAQGVAWREIEVLRKPWSAPTLHLHGQAAARAEALNVGVAHVTLTHAMQICSAVVILEHKQP